MFEGFVATTVTETGALVVVLLERSRATAVIVWPPGETVVESQTTEYGGAMTSLPTGEPSTKKRTPAIPTLSEALAASETKLETVDPPVGAVTATVGGVVSLPLPPPTAVFMSVAISVAFSARL